MDIKPDHKLFWFNYKLNDKLINVDYIENRDVLDRLKNEISLFYDLKKKDNPWNNIVDRTFPFSLVTSDYTKFKRVFKINRAYHKLKEILHEFNFNNIRDALCLCEAPGGFVQALKLHNKNTKWTAVSLPNSIKFSSIIEREYHGRIIYKDIINDQLTFDDKFDFITADGGFDTSSQYIQQEDMSSKLILSEIELAYKYLKEGGHFIIKMFDIYNSESQDSIVKLYKNFKSVNICKPPCSKPSNSEKYIVCKYYVPNGIDRTKKEIDQVISLIHDVISYSSMIQEQFIRKGLSQLWEPNKKNIEFYYNQQLKYKILYERIYKQ